MGVISFAIASIEGDSQMEEAVLGSIWLENANCCVPQGSQTKRPRLRSN